MKLVLASLVFVLCYGTCFAGRCDDLEHLCDLTDKWARVEARVVTSDEPVLGDYARLVLAMRLRALTVQRARLAELESNPSQKVVVSAMGWCGFTIGSPEPDYRGTAELKALRDYVAGHNGVIMKYDQATEAKDVAIQKELGDSRRECHAILKRYIPSIDED